MKEEEKKKLPWIAFPGVIRPNFQFKKIQFSVSTNFIKLLFYSILLFGIFYIYSGGVYISLKNPISFLPVEGGIRLIYRGQDNQYLYEGIGAGLLMLAGSLGLYFLREAAKDPHDTMRAAKYQVIGTLLILFAVFILERMMQCKSGLPPDKLPDHCKP